MQYHIIVCLILLGSSCGQSPTQDDIIAKPHAENIIVKLKGYGVPLDLGKENELREFIIKEIAKARQE